jgi:hypothetical protein
LYFIVASELDDKKKEAALEKKYNIEPVDATVTWKRILADREQV